MAENRIDINIDYRKIQMEKITYLKIANKHEIEDLIFQFCEDYYTDGLDLKNLSKKYSDKAKVVMACIDQMPLGYVAYYINDNITHVAFITMVVVKKIYRNQGIAKLILNYVINDCYKNGFSTIRLEVNNSNQNAKYLYKKLGFKFESAAGEYSSFYKLKILEQDVDVV